MECGNTIKAGKGTYGIYVFISFIIRVKNTMMLTKTKYFIRSGKPISF